ncbi:MAG: ABC transporter ATP-binding protein, partial [Owenweeksia sp.]
EFAGCLIVVTHDRYFMDKLTDHLFVFEGDGKVRDFPGNYTEYTITKAHEEELEKLRSKSMVKGSPAPKKSEKQKTKLTYAERLEMEELEKELEKLESRKAGIAGEFEEAVSDAERLENLSREMNEINEAIEEKEMRWLELSEFGE